MRNLSFALTSEQIRNRSKTVTRRKGTWWAEVLEPGTRLCAVEKSQGIKKGELVRLCVVEVVRVQIEQLCDMVDEDLVDEPVLEGFPGMTPSEFVDMFCDHMRCTPGQLVTRIEFEYVTQTFACEDCSQGVMDRENSHRNGLCRCACHLEETFR